MIDALTIGLFTAAAAVCGLLAVRMLLAAKAARHRETFRLTFPRSVDPAQVTAALRSIQGLLPRFPDRLVVTRSVGFETVATAAGITHYLTAPAGKGDLIVGQLRAAIPGLRVVPAVAPDRYANVARELVAVGVGSLRGDIAAESNAATLASIQPLGANEAVIVQWSLSPTEPLPGWLLWLRGHREAPESEDLPVEPQLRAVCRVGVRGLYPDTLLGRVFGAVHRADAAERRLRRRLLPSAWVASRLARTAAPVLSRSVLGADELAAVIGFPIAGPQLPGLGFAESRTLPPAPDVPTRGRILGDAIATGQPVAIGGESGSRTGLLVTSPTGSGKSTVLEHLCAADFAAGHGVVVIETKGDLVHRLANLTPPDRLDDVILFDPADPRPAGFNLLAAGDESADLIADHVVGQFRRLYAGYLGPRSEMLLRAALLTLSQAPGEWTICEAMGLLQSPTLRRRLMSAVADHELAATWAWFDAQSEAARAEMVGPLANKLAAFTLRRKLRAVVGQGKSALDFDAILREEGIALIALPTALIGEDAAALLGSCILAELWAAIQRRAALAPSKRPFASVVLDEAQDFLRLPGISVGDASAKSRSMGAGWTVSLQSRSQIEPDLRGTLLANLRSKVVFQTTADDARAFAREFAPHLDAADLQGLGPFEAFAAVSTGAAVAPPASIRTRPPLAPVGHGDEIRARSRERFGRDPKEVDAEIQARLGTAAPDAPVGARRRR